MTDDPVHAQYEAYPYPERDPAAEASRLIVGSPSDPTEIDHVLFGGKRDWSAPFCALVAGGGTGDGLVMLAQRLADIGCPAQITYIDLSRASRKIAEARIAARGLTSVTFITGSLLDAPDHGPFDYIDCCGVLHHLPDPDLGFAALAGALAPGGGIGLMVYAPHGRTGVYPLQSALRALSVEGRPEQAVKDAKAVLAALPETNWFRKNALLVDHMESDAGLYDLLLHARDRPYGAPDLIAALARAGLELTQFLEPARYDPMSYLPPRFAGRVKALDMAARAGVAEDLAGSMKLHIAYATRAGERPAPVSPTPDATPRLNGVAPVALARQIAAKGELAITFSGLRMTFAIPKAAAPMIALMDGRTLGEIAAARGLDWFAFAQAYGPAHRVLTGVNRLRYSKGAP